MSASTASKTSTAARFTDSPRSAASMRSSAVGHLSAAGEYRAVGAHRPLGHPSGVGQPGAPKVSPAASRPGKPPRLRLTRRGRIVLIGLPLVLLAALILSLAGLLNSPAKAADNVSGLAVTPTVSVTVQPGESLWAIAGKVDPDRDPRDVIADIVQLNDLQAGKVMPGQQLFVPNK